MVFAILISLLILILISVSVFFFFSFFNRDAKSGISSNEKEFIVPINQMKVKEKIAVVKAGVVTPLKAGRVQITAMECVDARKASVIINIKERPTETKSSLKRANKNTFLDSSC